MGDKLSQSRRLATTAWAKEFAEDCSPVTLTLWLHKGEWDEQVDDEELEDEPSFYGACREAIEMLGGPPTTQQLRERLAERRAQLASNTADARHASSCGIEIWKRQTLCPCGIETKQLLHGCTELGALWKGHLCACRGWECYECGRLVDSQGVCCK